VRHRGRPLGCPKESARTGTRRYNREVMDSQTLTALLNETASLRKRLAPKILFGLSQQELSLANGYLQKAEDPALKSLAERKRRNEVSIDWGTPDELIHLARRVIEEAEQLRIVMHLNSKIDRVNF